MSTEPDSLPHNSREGSVINQIPTTETPRIVENHTSNTKFHLGVRHSKRPQTSMIWMHHRKSSDGSPLVDRDGDTIWSCQYCPKIYKYKSGTRKALEHLQRSHNIDKSTNQTREQDEIKSLFHETNSAIDTSRVKELYLKWIMSDPAALKQARSPEFRAFLESISNYANTLLFLNSSQVEDIDA